MKLWLISQNEFTGFDTFDSAVVAAKTKDHVAEMRPRRWGEFVLIPWNGTEEDYVPPDWTNDPAKVKVTLIGEALPGTPRSVICASFNAG